MRIIGGKFKGRRFNPPAKNWPTRPTTDFAKEGLFNILTNELDFAAISALDLFGGTGSHGYELISRGCEDVTYVDKFPGAVRFVRKILRELDVEAYMQIEQQDVFRFISSCRRKFDYIFAGPPYPLPNLDSIPDLIFDQGMLHPGGWLVLEHNPHHHFEDHPRFLQLRSYGKTQFSFFEEPAE
jgi:16S rRNA (guanine(966)-N(2))-methyltransferase RsmD